MHGGQIAQGDFQLDRPLEKFTEDLPVLEDSVLEWGMEHPPLFAVSQDSLPHQVPRIGILSISPRVRGSPLTQVFVHHGLPFNPHSGMITGHGGWGG